MPLMLVLLTATGVLTTLSAVYLSALGPGTTASMDIPVTGAVDTDIMAADGVVAVGKVADGIVVAALDVKASLGAANSAATAALEAQLAAVASEEARVAASTVEAASTAGAADSTVGAGTAGDIAKAHPSSELGRLAATTASRSSFVG